MADPKKHIFLSPEEYLEFEEKSSSKHEYVAGQLYAMVGASEPHNLIVGAFYTSLRMHLRGSPCRVFMSDMKVKTENAFYYPDILVSCNSRDSHAYYKTIPLLIVEVISPTTRVQDEREKRVAYQALGSLREYVLAEQDRAEVRVYRRLSDQHWELDTYPEDGVVQLSSVGLALSVQSLYEDVWR